MSEITKPVVLDETGRAMVAAMERQTRLMGAMVARQLPAEATDWESVRAIVRAGAAPDVFAIGDQLHVPWKDGAEEYDLPFDVVDFADAELPSGEKAPAMWLQSHYALPFGTCYDEQEAFYVVPEGATLAPGTYNVTTGYSQANMVEGKTYQFTTTAEVPAGGQLVGFYGAWDRQPSEWRVASFSGPSSTSAIESGLVVTEGSAGTSLGTFSRYGGEGEALWGLQQSAYGYNSWEKSNLRQWLNSSAAAGSWYSPTHAHDRAPASYAGKAGFMAGLPADFVAVLGKPALGTAENYVSEGGTANEPTVTRTTDRIFLPSLEQHWIQPYNAACKGVEGGGWEYWHLAAESAAPLELYKTYPQLVTYAVNSKTSPQTVWMRSPHRGGAYTSYIVTASGHVYNYGCMTGYRAAPACVIF